MGPPSLPLDGVAVTWGFIEWAVAGAWGCGVVICGLLWSTAKRVGGFEERFEMLESQVRSNRSEAIDRATSLDGRLNSVDASTRKIENATSGMSDRFNELRDDIRDVRSLLNELMKRPH